MTHSSHQRHRSPARRRRATQITGLNARIARLDAIIAALAQHNNALAARNAELEVLHAGARPFQEATGRLDAGQAQLLQSAKLAAVGELAASIAHEINNPLYAARNSLYLIEQDLPSGTPQHTFLEIAQLELGRIARIITRMRDFYRPAPAELAPTDVNVLIRETLELVQIRLHHGLVNLVTGLAAELPPIAAHADQLRQVLLNLMLNACDAMPEGGTLRLTTRLQPAGGDQPSQIVITVSDTGSGIAAEHLPRMFEPFYTTKPQGTGLGLAISLYIITQHGGTLVPESAAGKGTTFTVTLPLAAPAKL